MQADALLQTFSAGCPSQGEWTKTALDHTRALLSTLEAIKNDPDCKTIPGAIAQLSGLDQQLTALTKNPNDVEYLGLKRTSEALLLQLENTEDPLARDAILASLRQVELDLAKTDGFLEADRGFDRKARLGHAMQQLVGSTQTMLQQISANQQCMQKNPGLLSSVVSVAGTVAAASMTSGASLIASAGVGLYGHIVEFLSGRGIQKQINKASDILVRSAMQCGLEALSNQWCAAQDSLELIKTASYFTGEGPVSINHPVVKGAQLLKRDVPAFLGWLDRIGAGAEANNMATGQRIGRAQERLRMVQLARAQGIGLVNENQRLFDGARGDSKLEWNVVKTTIRDIGANLAIYSTNGMLYSTSTPNPMVEVIDAAYAPYYLLGLKRNEVPKGGAQTESLLSFEDFDPFAKWPLPTPFKPSMATVKAQLSAWIEDSEKKARAERDLVLNPDIVQTMFESLIPGPNRTEYPAYNAMLNLSQYIYGWRNSEFFPQDYGVVASDTLTRLRKIRAEITSSTQAVRKRESESGQAKFEIDEALKKKIEVSLGEIYKLSVLDFGSSFFSGRLETIIRLISLESLSRQGNAVFSQNVIAKMMASQNMISELTRFSGNDDLTLIGRDIQKSQQATQELLQIFGGAFADSINDSMRFYKKRIKQMHETSSGLNAQELADLCFKILAIPFKLDGVDLSACQGARLMPIVPGGPASEVWEPVLQRRTFERRACVYRDFLRQNRIYQYEKHGR